MRQRDRNKRRRVERQEEAAVRQATYDALTPDEKLFRATTGSRPGHSLRERLRFDLDAEPIGGVRLA